MDHAQLSGRLADAPQAKSQDLADVAASGVAGIINNRPDEEAPESGVGAFVTRSLR